MLRKPRFIVLVIVTLIISGTISAQNKLDAWSISPKIGGFVSPDQTDATTGVLIGIEGNLMKNNFMYSLNHYYGNELIIYGSGPDRHFNQTSFLFGRYHQANFFRFDYQAGISAMWGTKYTAYHSEGFLSGYNDIGNYSIIGLLVKIGGEFILSDSYAMGSHLIVNLNNEMSNIALILSFSFGKHKN